VRRLTADGNADENERGEAENNQLTLKLDLARSPVVAVGE